MKRWKIFRGVLIDLIIIFSFFRPHTCLGSDHSFRMVRRMAPPRIEKTKQIFLKLVSSSSAIQVLSEGLKRSHSFLTKIQNVFFEWPISCLFLLQINVNNIYGLFQWKYTYMDGVLGIRIHGHGIDGANEPTGLWTFAETRFIFVYSDCHCSSHCCCGALLCFRSWYIWAKSCLQDDFLCSSLHRFTTTKSGTVSVEWASLPKPTGLECLAP